jgi:hypothetical protein
MEPAKEALFIVIDVSETMRPHLDDVRSALRMIINQKILFHKQDVVGVATMGALSTNNRVQATTSAVHALCLPWSSPSSHPQLNAEHGEGYEHLSVVHQMKTVSFETMSAISSVQCEGECADLIDALCMAMDAVIEFVGEYRVPVVVAWIKGLPSPWMEATGQRTQHG